MYTNTYILYIQSAKQHFICLGLIETYYVHVYAKG